jgi:hypothetical protein
MAYDPLTEDKFSGGLWCTTYAGREVFGTGVRPRANYPFGYQRLDQLTLELLTGVR